MSWHNLVFPENLSYGTRGGAGFSTAMRGADSGPERRKTEWETQKSRVQYDVAKSVQTTQDVAELLDFYLCVRGSACGFRFKDPLDFTSDPDGTTLPTTVGSAQAVKGIGVASGVTRKFQLQKEVLEWDYTQALSGKYREITKPIAPGQDGHAIQVYIDGTLTWESDASGVESDGVTTVAVDYDLGTLILDSSFAPERIKVGFTFHVPARFGQEADDGLDIIWEQGGTFSVGSIPVVEITGGAGNAAEEWLAGGHTSHSIPSGGYKQDYYGKLTRDGMVQQYTAAVYPQSKADSVTLENMQSGATVPRRRQTPLVSGENFTGGPLVLVFNTSGAAATLEVNTYDASGQPTAILYDLGAGKYVELYWLGNTLGYVAR
tara:strand:+ start:855 stop:1982 length:1128 start_codon:yes stop_codon:yes gene_type:complete